MSIEQTAIPADNFYNSSCKGIRSWIFSTDHKRIGLLYFIFVDCRRYLRKFDKLLNKNIFSEFNIFFNFG